MGEGRQRVQKVNNNASLVFLLSKPRFRHTSPPTQMLSNKEKKIPKPSPPITPKNRTKFFTLNPKHKIPKNIINILAECCLSPVTNPHAAKKKLWGSANPPVDLAFSHNLHRLINGGDHRWRHRVRRILGHPSKGAVHQRHLRPSRQHTI